MCADDAELAIFFGPFDPSLYELDQVEVGRRLDNSRWLNFVEISQSLKWSDISDKLHLLLECEDGFFREKYTLPRFNTGDRLRGEVGRMVSIYLNILSEIVSCYDHTLFQDIEYIANKDKRFQGQ